VYELHTKIPFNFRLEKDIKTFSFTLNITNQSCAVGNLVSNETSFAIFAFFYNLYGIKHVSAKEKQSIKSLLQKTPPQNSLFLAHLSLLLCFLLQVGPPVFFFLSPSLPLLTATGQAPERRRRGSSALHFGAHLLDITRQSSTPLFPPRRTAHWHRTRPPTAAAARPQWRSCSGDPRVSQPSGTALVASTSPPQRARASSKASQRPEPRSPRWRYGTAACGSATAFLPKR
jgi:hypothetical protein